MNTTLEKILDWLETKIEEDKDGLFNLYVLRETQVKIEALFEEERKQIVDAFDYGYASGYDESQGDGETYIDGNDYYDKTFLTDGKDE